jgi:ectoine hydroxylase-related dioxygenase (phytanoyl-CoA dioxygenase family)
MNLRNDVEEFGFAIRRGALGPQGIPTLLQLVQSVSDHQGVARTRGGPAYAARNLLWKRPEIGLMLFETGLNRLASEVLGRDAFPINATYFDKTPNANWAVPGHQDLMMPVEREVAEPSFTGWRTKSGVVYVEPSTEVLSKLVALRVHFDDCPAANGALAVVSGSHLNGKLRDAQISAIAADRYTICAAAAGDVLVMKPLIVHRSSPTAVPAHRRVLHVVYAAEQPGVEVRWKRGVSGA